jgi:hypothetical protein
MVPLIPFEVVMTGESRATLCVLEEESPVEASAKSDNTEGKAPRRDYLRTEFVYRR